MTMLNLQNINFHLPENNRSILRNISCKVNEGDFIILLGSNGSGKSTLLKLIQRQYHMTSGEATLLNKSLHQYKNDVYSRLVSTLTQNCHEALFPALTVYENYFLFQKEKSNKTALKNHLHEFNPNLCNKLDILVQELSGGEKQALALALYLLNPPKLLLLDEHTSALDPKTSAQIMLLTQKFITKHHMTCIMTTHDLDIAMQYGNKIVILKEGKIANELDKSNMEMLTKENLVMNY